MSKVVCIMLAGGKGKRMDTDVSKQYLLLEGKPVLFYSLKAFEPYVDEIVIVAAKGEEQYCQAQIVDKYGINKVTSVVTGGAERYLSVYEGLKAVSYGNADELEAEEKYVLIHDGARPFIEGRVIENVINKVKECKACIAAVPSKDTVKIGNECGLVEDTPDRNKVWLVQTPQAFEYGAIFNAYEKAIRSKRTDITDDSMVMEEFGDHSIHFVMGAYDNIKLTTPEDLIYGTAIIGAKIGCKKKY